MVKSRSNVSLSHALTDYPRSQGPSLAPIGKHDPATPTFQKAARSDSKEPLKIRGLSGRFRETICRGVKLTARATNELRVDTMRLRCAHTRALLGAPDHTCGRSFYSCGAAAFSPGGTFSRGKGPCEIFGVITFRRYWRRLGDFLRASAGMRREKFAGRECRQEFER